MVSRPERLVGRPDFKGLLPNTQFRCETGVLISPCFRCKTPYADDMMRDTVSKREVPHCPTPQCNGLVKPDIVFFGEALPEEFHQNRALPGSADLCIVMGTSLTVQPFASLPIFCAEGVPRLLINSERVGSFGSRADDVLLLGDCDAGVREFAVALGWDQELEELWNETEPLKEENDTEPKNSKDGVLEDEIATLTKKVDESLKISGERAAQIRDQLK